VLKDTVSNKELAAKSRLGIKKGLACIEQIPQKRRRFLFRQISAFGFFMSDSGTLASAAVFVDTGGYYPGEPTYSSRESAS